MKEFVESLVPHAQYPHFFCHRYPLRCKVHTSPHVYNFPPGLVLRLSKPSNSRSTSTRTLRAISSPSSSVSSSRPIQACRAFGWEGEDGKGAGTKWKCRCGTTWA